MITKIAENHKTEEEDLSGFDRVRDVYVTPSEVLEYLYCPRFIYFMTCLCIPQHEELRYKVLMGRQLHEKRARLNKNYLLRKIGCIDKEVDVYLSSEQYHVKGEVDEVLFLDDGTCAPLDYKFAEYKDKTFLNHKFQSVLYALLIKENFHREVIRGYICYVRSRNLLKIIQYSNDDFERGIEIIGEILSISQGNKFPTATRYKIRCIDCCYRNICVK